MLCPLIFEQLGHSQYVTLCTVAHYLLAAELSTSFQTLAYALVCSIDAGLYSVKTQLEDVTFADHARLFATAAPSALYCCEELYLICHTAQTMVP